MAKENIPSDMLMDELRNRLHNLYGNFAIYRTRQKPIIRPTFADTEPEPEPEPEPKPEPKRSTVQFLPIEIPLEEPIKEDSEPIKPLDRQETVELMPDKGSGPKLSPSEETPLEKTKSEPEPSETIFVESAEPISVPSDEHFIDYQQNDIHYLIPQPVDYVLVCYKEKFEKRPELQTFLKNLYDQGIESIAIPGVRNSTLLYILIHGVPTALQHFAHVYSVEQRFRNTCYSDMSLYGYQRFRKYLHTPLTLSYGESQIAHRNPDLFLEPTGPTVSEREMIIAKVLARTRYDPAHYGTLKLISTKYLITTYPLHDGSCDWSEKGFLNYRQALAKYWASIRNICKYQPLDVIEKYFGSEVAMYFSMQGYYNNLLLPVAILSIIFFIVGIIYNIISTDQVDEELCHSNRIMCPRCRGDPEDCKFIALRNSCYYATLTTLVDNPIVVSFSVVMLIWGVFAMNMWKRQEILLQVKWNLLSTAADSYVRVEFEEKTRYKKRSIVTGHLEAYLPLRVKLLRIAYSLFICTLMVLMMLLGVIAITFVRLFIRDTYRSLDDVIRIADLTLYTNVPSAIVMIIIIKIFKIIIPRVCLWLTYRENPRTQVEFDNSYIYKWTTLSCINFFTPLFYMAFYRPLFATTPYEWRHGHLFDTDVCHPSGCMFILSVHLFFLFLSESYIFKYIGKLIWEKIHDLKKKRQLEKEILKLPQWELDYTLLETSRYFLVQHFVNLVIQYGLMLFFVIPFPIGPFWCLLNNILEVRASAYDLLHHTRKPVARKLVGIGNWKAIMRFITWLSIATNAFIIAITSEFVHRYLYMTQTGSLKGYINSTVSVFDVRDFEVDYDFEEKICYYKGSRNPPSHPFKYRQRHEYYYYSSGKILFVLVFVHTLIFVAGVLDYAIPDTPFAVKEHWQLENAKIKEIKAKKLLEKFQTAKASKSKMSETSVGNLSI